MQQLFFISVFQNNFHIHQSHQVIQSIPCKFKNVLGTFSFSDLKKMQGFERLASAPKLDVLIKKKCITPNENTKYEMDTNCHTFGSVNVTFFCHSLRIETSTGSKFDQIPIAQPKRSKRWYVPHYNSENTPPYGTYVYVQGKNEMEEKKRTKVTFGFPLLNCLPLSHKQHFIIAFQHSSTELRKHPCPENNRHSARCFLSSHNITRCCLVLSCSLTMISRQLRSTSHLGVKIPIVITSRPPRRDPLTSQINGRKMSRKGMMLISLLHGDIIWWL